MANAPIETNRDEVLTQAICRLSEIGSMGALLVVAADSGNMDEGETSNLGRVIERMCQQLANALEDEQARTQQLAHQDTTPADHSPTSDVGKPVRFLSDVAREAKGCLFAAEELLLAYYADDTKAGRLLRVERVTALVQAAATVVRSIEGEGVSHG